MCIKYLVAGQFFQISVKSGIRPEVKTPNGAPLLKIGSTCCRGHVSTTLTNATQYMQRNMNYNANVEFVTLDQYFLRFSVVRMPQLAMIIQNCLLQ